MPAEQLTGAADNEQWLQGAERLLEEFRQLANLPCRTGKQRHASKRQALSHAAAATRGGRDHSRTSAFRCGYCGDWHIGRR